MMTEAGPFLGFCGKRHINDTSFDIHNMNLGEWMIRV
jgi:hypothetical protein